MRSFKALDLYCGAGSVSIGLLKAGFARVTGIDLSERALKHYPYKSFKFDVLKLTPDYLRNFDFIWASPPCQAHTPLNVCNGLTYEDYIPDTRKLLDSAGVPYVIENVPQAPIRRDLMLCGSMFQLRLRRHRTFESSFTLRTYFKCNCRDFYVATRAHQYNADDPNCILTLAGDNYGSKAQRALHLGETRQLQRDLTSQAIPPIFAQHIGEQALRYLLRAL